MSARRPTTPKAEDGPATPIGIETKMGLTSANKDSAEEDSLEEEDEDVNLSTHTGQGEQWVTQQFVNHLKK